MVCWSSTIGSIGEDWHWGVARPDSLTLVSEVELNQLRIGCTILRSKYYFSMLYVLIWFNHNLGTPIKLRETELKYNLFIQYSSRSTGISGYLYPDWSARALLSQDNSALAVLYWESSDISVTKRRLKKKIKERKKKKKIEKE